MKLMFCTSNLPGAILIRAFTWSQWSHVAVLVDEHTAVEAVWPRVRKVELAALKARHKKWCIVDVPVADEAAAIAFAERQIGKPYDLGALFGFLAHRDWSRVSEWFCSELGAATIEAGGDRLFRHELIRRLAPQHLWMLDFDVLESFGGLRAGVVTRSSCKQEDCVHVD